MDFDFMMLADASGLFSKPFWEDPKPFFSPGMLSIIGGFIALWKLLQSREKTTLEKIAEVQEILKGMGINPLDLLGHAGSVAAVVKRGEEPKVFIQPPPHPTATTQDKLQELSAKYQAAVDAGKPALAEEISRQYHRLKGTASQ